MDFENTPVSSVSMKIPTNADGNIATTSETATGEKSFTIDGIKVDANLTQATAVFTAFLSICDTYCDELTAKKTIVQGVE